MTDPEQLADRIKAAAEQIPDARARTFREFFTNNTRPGQASGRWLLDLENIKQALAASDDPVTVAVTGTHLEDR